MNNEVEWGKRFYKDKDYRRAALFLDHYLRKNKGECEIYELFFKSITEDFSRKNYVIFNISFAFMHFEEYLKLFNADSNLIKVFKEHFKIVIEETVTELTNNFTSKEITIDDSSLFDYYQKFICENNKFTKKYIKFRNKIRLREKIKEFIKEHRAYIFVVSYVILVIIIILLFYHYFML